MTSITRTVINGNDSGPGSLRQAILDSNGNNNPINVPNIIQIDASVLEITITTTNIEIIRSVTITYLGQPNKCTIKSSIQFLFTKSSSPENIITIEYIRFTEVNRIINFDLCQLNILNCEIRDINITTEMVFFFLSRTIILIRDTIFENINFNSLSGAIKFILIEILQFRNTRIINCKFRNININTLRSAQSPSELILIFVNNKDVNTELNTSLQIIDCEFNNLIYSLPNSDLIEPFIFRIQEVKEILISDSIFESIEINIRTFRSTLFNFMIFNFSDTDNPILIYRRNYFGNNKLLLSSSNISVSQRGIYNMIFIDSASNRNMQITFSNSTFFRNIVEATECRNIQIYGPILVSQSRFFKVINCTIDSNECRLIECTDTGINGGGISYSVGRRILELTIGNTIVTRNRLTINDSPADPNLGYNIFSNNQTINSLGGNLFGDQDGFITTNATDIINPDPLLDDPQDNGGNTLTMAPLRNSPALSNGIVSINDSLTDQRGEGFARVVNNSIDIGAYQLQFICYSGDSYVLTKEISTNIVAEIQVKDLIADKYLVFDSINNNFIPVKYNIKFNTKQKKFIKIEKNLIEENIPNKDLYITSGHYVLINGKEIKAIKVPKAKKVKTEPQNIYTICTEKRTAIKINNMDVMTWGYEKWSKLANNKHLIWYDNK